jgi:hypothetical protein
MSDNGAALLGVYLNDHLAGATAGLELARRIARSPDRPYVKDTMRRIVTEVAEDRTALLDIMRSIGVPVRHYKVCAGWVAEKAGRFKPNGRLVGRSPLSSVEELEALRLGVVGKAAGWRTLRDLANRDGRLDPQRLDGLLGRAERQEQTLEDVRARRAAEVLAPV